MAKGRDPREKEYFFIDIDVYSRQILAWDTDTKENVQVCAPAGCHRVFLSRGQYNKLVQSIEAGRE